MKKVMKKVMKKLCKQAPLFLGWLGSAFGLFALAIMHDCPDWVVLIGVVILAVLYLCGLIGLEED